MKNLYDIDWLQAFIESNWSFNRKNYPKLPNRRGEAQHIFALNHVAKHLQKEIGKLMRILEEWDHGRPLPDNFEKQMGDILRDLLIQTLRMNALEGKSAFDLALSVHNLYTKKKRSKKK